MRTSPSAAAPAVTAPHLADRSRPLPAPPTLLGAVRRTLLVDADGTRDTTSSVTWLQGPSLYVDLRVPADPTAAREGFAGRWSVDGDLARWTRVVDVAPTPPSGGAPDPAPPDEGRLRWDGDVLVEDGVHVAYTEHWQLPAPATSSAPAAGLLLARGEQARGVLVRVGELFGWAADDERGPWVALGVVEAGAWRVTSATRPEVEGVDLAVGACGGGVVVAGESWRVTESEGDAAALI